MKTHRWIILGFLGASLVLLGGVAWARTAQNVSVDPRVIGSGGVHLAQGTVSLDNTLAQPVLGVYIDGNVALCAGFWCQPAVEPCIALRDADVAGPPTTTVDVGTAFTATVGAISATLPVTYTWAAAIDESGLSYVTHTGGLSDTAVFTWGVSGPRTVTVTAVSPCGVAVSATHAITVEERWNVYLPMVVKEVGG